MAFDHGLTGKFGLFFLVFGLAMIFMGSPILTYFYGKRWYCSWVCGCGGLAETAGDLSDNYPVKLKPKLERWMIHAALVFVTVTTIAAIWSFITQNPELSLISRTQFISGVVVFIMALMLSFFGIKLFEKDAIYPD